MNFLHLKIESFSPCKRGKRGYAWSPFAGLRTEASHGLTKQKKKIKVKWFF